ncbi:insulinase family protein [bacterium]|nr:MAG: insulinase family protein [bacterium]
MIYFEPKETADGRTLQECKQAIEQELKNIMNNGVTDQELTCFKKSSITNTLKVFDQANSAASIFESLFFKNNNELQLFSNISTLENLTQQDIKDFCAHNLQHYLTHTFLVMPLPEEQKTAWQSLQDSLDAYEQSALTQKIRDSEIEEPRLSDQLPEPALLTLAYEHPDKKITLANGLEVYLKYRDTSPFVHASLRFKNSEQLSLALQNTNQTELAELALNLLSEGSQDYSKQDNQAFFDLLGALWNLGSYGGFFSCLPEDLMLVAERFVHILTKPTYPENMFLQMQADKIDRIKQAQENNFYQAQKLLNEHLFKNYPWIKTDEQTIERLEAIKYSDLREAHKRFTNPALMFLALVGNFDETTITEQLEETFGVWQQQSSDNLVANMPIIPDLENPEAIAAHKFLPKEQVVLVAGRITTTFDTDDRFCLKLLELYLNKCLYEIRERTGLFYSCNGSLSLASYLTKGSSSIRTLVSIDKVDEAQAAIKQVLQTICDKGIDEKNLLVAKQNYQVNLAKGFSTNASLAESYASLVQTNRPWTDFNDCIDRVHRLSCNDVNNAAKKYLDPNSWSFITVGRTLQHART